MLWTSLLLLVPTVDGRWEVGKYYNLFNPPMLTFSRRASVSLSDFETLKGIRRNNVVPMNDLANDQSLPGPSLLKAGKLTRISYDTWRLNKSSRSHKIET
jgi:hypothetical protein